MSFDLDGHVLLEALHMIFRYQPYLFFFLSFKILSNVIGVIMIEGGKLWMK